MTDMSFIKENFDTSSFLPYPRAHFFAVRIDLMVSDWLEHKRGSKDLSLILIALHGLTSYISNKLPYPYL